METLSTCCLLIHFYFGFLFSSLLCLLCVGFFFQRKRGAQRISLAMKRCSTGDAPGHLLDLLNDRGNLYFLTDFSGTEWESAMCFRKEHWMDMYSTVPLGGSLERGSLWSYMRLSLGSPKP